MHPFLTRLGIRQEVQDFFAPYYVDDEQGNLLFDYGEAAEHFGFAFHRIPVSENCWQAGCRDFNMVSRVFICSSAMEAIAFYHFKYSVYTMPGSLFFIAVGARPDSHQFRWINEHLAGKVYLLVFGNGLLDKVGELKTAAGINKLPLSIKVDGNNVYVNFRLREYVLPIDTFSLSAFEKLSGYRFKVKTARSKNGEGYLTQIKSAALNY